MEQSKVFDEQTPDQRRTKALNVWLIVTNWMTFLKTMFGAEQDAPANRNAIRHGVYQVLDFIAPHLREGERQQVVEFQKSYCFEGLLPE